MTLRPLRGAVWPALALLALAAPCAVAAELEQATTHALIKVRPNAPLPESSPVELGAARNEFEAFQLVLRGAGGAVAEIDVEPGDLVAEQGGGRIDRRFVAVYLEGFLDLARPSSSRGAVGEWPDPLLPRVDAYAGERRNAFPFAVEDGRNQPLWIEVFVPPETPAGSYRGELAITVAGEPRSKVPWSLEVWPFTLPATASYRTSFGFSGLSALRVHRGGYTDERDLRELTQLYAAAALRHRISFYGGTMSPPPTVFRADEAKVDWRFYDEEVAPLLDGTLLGAGTPLAGARVTSIDVRTPPSYDDRQRVLYWRAWVEHFRERGWLDRLFLYVWDEPTEEEYPEVARLASLARRAEPALPVLLTETLVPQMAEHVDVWVPLVNCFVRAGVDTCGGEPVLRPSYRQAERGGARVWWYQSCASHGCFIVGGDPFRPWPSYMIDAPATAHRVLPWLAWRLGIEGELYFNTVEAYNGEADPWRDVYLFGGNGDGTLFYPGTPRRIGGRSHVPVESLRLKVIRDGLEDYEYLVLAAEQGLRPFAVERSAAVAHRVDQWQRDPEAYYAARAAIARQLAQRAEGGSP